MVYGRGRPPKVLKRSVIYVNMKNYTDLERVEEAIATGWVIESLTPCPHEAGQVYLILTRLEREEETSNRQPSVLDPCDRAPSKAEEQTEMGEGSDI